MTFRATGGRELQPLCSRTPDGKDPVITLHFAAGTIVFGIPNCPESLLLLLRVLPSVRSDSPRLFPVMGAIMMNDGRPPPAGMGRKVVLYDKIERTVTEENGMVLRDHQHGKKNELLS